MDNPPDPSKSPFMPSFWTRFLILYFLCSIIDFVMRIVIDYGFIGTYCGLCGKQGELTRTKCCNRVICDDTHLYKPFTYSRVSCYRNHDRYTVCSSHATEHPQETCDWRECAKCTVYFAEVESYVGMGTSNCNFAEDNWDPPTFELTHCSRCHRVIKLNAEGHTRLPTGGFECERCSGMS